MSPKRIKKCLSFFISAMLASQITIAAPWFTGPLLAPGGRTVPLGHANIELYGLGSQNTGYFTNTGKLIHNLSTTSYQANPILSYGLSDRFDAQWSLPYVVNTLPGRHYEHIDDATILLGYQAHRQQEGSYVPDFKITIQEVFPTGRFQALNSVDQGTGITGSGVYQTALGLNFQELNHLYEDHYLRTRLTFAYAYAASKSINGFNSFGGGHGTHGIIDPGNLLSADLAGEYTFTQHWAGVMEMYYAYRSKTRFIGNLGTTDFGEPASIGHGTVQQLSLAPALEYNFTENYGLIAGVWFSVAGQETTNFTTGVIAFNMFF